jgi:oligogalacturonide transport system substrate-binding protein
MKKHTFWLIIIILIFTISCGGKNDNSKGSEKEVTLRFLWWGGEARHKATLDAIKLFEEKNPGIKIKAEYGGTDGYFQKLSTQITGNTAPDIMQVDYIWLYNFSKNGDGFYDINTLTDEFNLDNYNKEDLDYTTINGKLTAIPVGMNGRAFFFNKSLYDRAGAEIPKTFDELLATDKILKEKIGKDVKSLDVITTDSGALFFLEYYVEQKYGKPIINPDNTMGVTKEELGDAFKFYKKLVDSGAVLSAKERAGAGNFPDDQNPMWIKGELGGILNWNTMIGSYEDMLKEGDVLTAGDFLTGIGEYKSALIKVNMTFAINKNTKYPKEAAKFLNFMLSDPEAAKILGTVRGIPLNKSAFAALEKDGVITGPLAEGLEKALKFAGSKGSPYIEDQRTRQLGLEITQKVDYNELTPEQAGEQMYTELEKLLKQMTR